MPRNSHPYTVTEQNFTIRLLQPIATNPHAVFHPRESIAYQYERNFADPRIAHAMTLEVDAFGSILESATVAYSRRQPDAPSKVLTRRSRVLSVKHFHFVLARRHGFAAPASGTRSRPRRSSLALRAVAWRRELRAHWLIW